MDLESDPRPNSYISLESDTPDCPASEEEEEGELEEDDPSNRCQSSTASLPPFPPLEAGDPDLTPTREDGGGIDLQASSPPTINNAWDQQVEVTVTDLDLENRPTPPRPTCIRTSLTESKKEWTPDAEELNEPGL